MPRCHKAAQHLTKTLYVGSLLFNLSPVCINTNKTQFSPFQTSFFSHSCPRFSPTVDFPSPRPEDERDSHRGAVA